MPGLSASLTEGMVQQKAPVLMNRRIARDHFLMRLKSPAAARRAQPGQFVHVLCEGESAGRSPLLRRPISMVDADPKKGTLDFIYKVLGLGTEVLSHVRAGSRVDFLGPVGRPFPFPRKGQAIWLVGGGVGIPPLVFLAKVLTSAGPADIRVFLGARTKDWVICAADFRKLKLPVHIATDDDTAGHCGSVVDLLAKNPVMQSPALYICGPTPMMAAAARWAKVRGIPAQVSLEERMGCAMGVCMGCVVEVNDEPVGSHARFQRVCTEGPVFSAEEIVWR